MPKLVLVLLTFRLAFAAQALPAGDTPIAVVHRLFDAMANHDANAARQLFIPDAMLYSVNAEGKAEAVSFEKWLTQLGESKGKWLERIWNPKVLEERPIAAVWAPYDFHFNDKFSHCGIDFFSLLKTDVGWRIASISDTRKKSGCATGQSEADAK
jgi:Putative lumazine-binding